MSKKHIQWLKDELPKLTEQEVISAKTSQKLQQHYVMDGLSSEQSLSLFTIILATIGGLLIGGGIILIFAYNWENIDRPMRTVLAFTPLVIAQVLMVMGLYPRKRGTAWREVSGVLLFCSVAAAISIIGQTYHISGDFQGFITWWFILLLPVVYLLRAHLMTMLIVILGGYAASNFTSAYFLCLLALLPYYIQETNNNRALTSIQTGWLWVVAFLIATPFQFIFGAGGLDSNLNLLCIGTCLYLTGSIIEESNVSWKRPMTIAGSLVLGGYLISLTFNDVLENSIYMLSVFMFNAIENQNHLSQLVILITSFSLLAYHIYARNFKLLVLPSVLVLYIPIGFLLALSDSPATGDSQTLLTIGSLAFTLLAVLISGWYIFLGIKEDSASKLNFGLIMIIGLVMFKFFVDDFSLVTRGIAFIVLGTALISVNVWHNRRSLI